MTQVAQSDALKNLEKVKPIQINRSHQLEWIIFEPIQTVITEHNLMHST